MRFKSIFVVVVSLVMVAAFCPLSFAFSQPSTIDSPLLEPSVNLASDGSSFSYCFVFYQNETIQGQSKYKVQIWNCTSSSGASWDLPNGAFYRITCTNPFTASCENYDAESGVLLGINYYNSSYGGVIHKEYIDCPPQLSGNAIDCFYIMLPEGVTSNVTSNTKYTNVPFINFASIVPYVHSYTSYLSEPVADPYNRYIVTAGEDKQYLYLISFAMSDLTMFDSQSINQGGDEVDLTYNNVFTPCIKLDENQLKLEIDIDPQIFYILNNTNKLYKYNLMIAKYNLLDGQYINSTLYNGSITSSETSISFDFGSVTDFDSIKTYGVQYIDTLNSSIHYNILRCSWGHDPDFESWQDDVLYFLEGIYNLMNTSEDETVTVADDTSAMNEMESAKGDLVVTDASGQAIDPAQAAEDNFSMAAEQIGELAEPVSTVNGLITSLIFDKPKLVLPIIVALALGLLVTILGKNKSD